MKISQTKNTIGIVCALPIEAEAFLPHFQSYESFKYYKRQWYTGEWNALKVIIVVSKVGSHHSREATEQLISNHNPEFVLNFGTAAQINPQLTVGTIVLGTHTLTYSKQPEAPLSTPTDSELLTLPFTSKAPIHQGLIISADQNIDDLELKKQLWEIYKAACGDWESDAIMRICQKNNCPSTAIRVISDSGESNFREEFYKNAEKVIPEAVIWVLRVIQLSFS